MRKLLLLLPLFATLAATAQVTRFDARLDNQCIFSGGIMDNELYRFNDDSQVPEWVEEILATTGETRHFDMLEASVENVSAVVDGERRYLLYSLDFVEKATRIEVYGALAHEIAHHVNGHTLRPEHRVREEYEADFFMGYFLSKKGFTQEDVRAFVRSLPSSYAEQNAKRLQASLDGYGKADRSLHFKSLAINNDPKAAAYQLPGFEFKKCYTQTEIPRATFAGRSTLGQVDEKIRLVLDTRGYSNRSYFSVANGFALVCQMEQYNRDDASIRNDRTRWLDYPLQDHFAGLWDQLSAVVVAKKGYFRLFVFVVTDQPFSAADTKVSKQEAAEWLSKGGNRLPEGIQTMAFSGKHYVSALVYEFEVPQSNHVPKQICPAPLHPAATHIRQSGLGFGL